MNDELARLLDAALLNPDAIWALVDALRSAALNEPQLLAEFARSGSKVQRKAAAMACGEQTDPEVVAAIGELATDPEREVRQELAYNLRNRPNWLAMDGAVEKLLVDADTNVRHAAAWAAQARPALLPLLLQRFHAEEDSWVRSEIAIALGSCPRDRVVADLLTQLAKDHDLGVQQMAAGSLEKHFASMAGFIVVLPRPPLAQLNEARKRVVAITHVTHNVLKNWLSEQLASFVDVEGLSEYGSIMSTDGVDGPLPRAFGMDEQVEHVLSLLEGNPPRAVVLLGESGAGKTALVQEVVHRLARHPEHPSHVLRMTPQDFMVNTKFLGEWETRVRNLVAAVKAPRRIVLYIPGIEELAWMGTWSKSESNVASNLAPFIERGDLTILGESTVEGFRKGLGANRSLRRLFHSVELQPTSDAATRAILRAVASESGALVPDPVLDRLKELAEYFASGSVQPGRSVGLLRRVLGLVEGRPGPVTEQDILHTLADSTGIPVSFLDDSIALDRAAVRHFFESRVMGQPEALEAVVDLVTLVKAGLNDPLKPFGVFLFVGPTGVGKTELARALAEHLFGDASRLVRFDMSEYATYEAHERLIGNSAGSEPGLLTATVRERPFCVILLDEIEKAHPNIYNLCLQIFDAGRLTDAQGRTVDFRRTIIILTSNVGSTVGTGPGLGLGREAPALPTRDTILRELGRWFRPEFLNRLDRIVTFRPLATETAERIAQREIARVLERAGITRRHLAVEVDPGVLPLLLREGYSQAFGARPLKRTIERMVLLPMARAIAEGKVPSGSFVRLQPRLDRVDIEVEPPEPPDAPAPPAPRASHVTDRAALLLQRMQDTNGLAAPLAADKSHLLAQSTMPGFWDDAANSRRVMDHVYRLDGILNGLSDLEKKIRAEVERVQIHRHSERDLTRIDSQLDGHESQLQHLAFLVRSQDPQSLGDALVTLRLATRQGQGLDAVLLLAKMYQKLAERRGLEASVLDDRRGGDPAEDTITLLVFGPGAYALLSKEAGLHPVSQGKKQDARVERDVVRVEVLPTPAVEASFAPGEIEVAVRPLGGSRGRLLNHINHEVRIFHPASMLSVRGWCEGSKTEAIERMKMLLSARLQAKQAAPETSETGRPPVVRRYRLGPTTLVRDQRTGRSTGRLDQVLQGDLDMFLLPPQG